MANLKNNKMKNVVIIVLFVPTILFGQKKCVSGNCENGFGKMTDLENQQVYEGNWKNGMKEGQGTYTDSYKTYTGNWHEDEQQGLGEYKEQSEHDGKTYISRIYTGNFEKFDHKGQGKCTMYDDWGKKIMFEWEGNFDSQQLSGKGSLVFLNEGTYYSDNFKDNFNFTTGYLIKKGTQQKIPGSLVKGVFKSDEITVATNTPKTLPPISYKTYIFKTQCSSRGKNFYVISKITADINRHPFDEIKYEATHLMSNNGWYAMSSTEYLGIEEEVKINGKPGKDYVVSESGLYEFKKN